MRLGPIALREQGQMAFGVGDVNLGRLFAPIVVGVSLPPFAEHGRDGGQGEIKAFAHTASLHGGKIGACVPLGILRDAVIRFDTGWTAMDGHSFKFLVTLVPGEDGCLVAECPALPGCMSQARTRAEALANIREAIEAVLLTRRDLGCEAEVEVAELEISIPA